VDILQAAAVVVLVLMMELTAAQVVRVAAAVVVDKIKIPQQAQSILAARAVVALTMHQIK
jgi:hypothetical protein